MDSEDGCLLPTVGVPPNLSGERADRILASCLPHLSRTKLQKFFRAGQVFCENKPIAARERLAAGKFLEIKPPSPEEKILSRTPEVTPFNILFEDGDILVIAKASGIAVHRGSGAQGPALVEILAAQQIPLSTLGGTDRPGIVHRLDKETSGVMVLARTDFAHQVLLRAFASREVGKMYHALVRGVPACLSGSIQEPIGRHPVHRTRQCVRKDGRPARSDWKILKIFGEHYAYLQVRIFTGRTHQIRVHLQHLGFPVLGDRTYGHRPRASDPCPFGRVMLHSHQLTIPHPRSGEMMTFCAPLAEDFQKKLSFLETCFRHPHDGLHETQ